MVASGTELATHNGRRLVVDGDRVVLVDLGTRWTVPLLIGVGFFFGIGVVFTLTYVPLAIARSVPWQGAAAAAATVVVLGTTLRWLIRYRRRMASRPLEQQKTVAIFDFDQGRLRTPDGSTDVSLGNVTLRSRRHVRTLASRLSAEWPEGRLVVVEEGVFSSGHGRFESILGSHGLRVERAAAIF